MNTISSCFKDFAIFSPLFCFLFFLRAFLRPDFFYYFDFMKKVAAAILQIFYMEYVLRFNDFLLIIEVILILLCIESSFFLTPFLMCFKIISTNFKVFESVKDRIGTL